MLLEDIEKQWAEDVEINPLKLDSESLKIPKLHAKYYKILVHEKMVLIKLKTKLEEKEHVLEQFYNKTLTIEELNHYNLPLVQDKKVMRQDIPTVIANRPDVIELKTKVGVQHIKIEFLESILKSIQGRNWNIRDAIEWRKFENGSY